MKILEKPAICLFIGALLFFWLLIFMYPIFLITALHRRVDALEVKINKKGGNSTMDENEKQEGQEQDPSAQVPGAEASGQPESQPVNEGEPQSEATEQPVEGEGGEKGEGSGEGEPEPQPA